MNYKLAYRLGFHPWEDAEGHPGFVEKISALFEREENGREPPYGRSTLALEAESGGSSWLSVAGRSLAWTTPTRLWSARTNGSEKPVSRCGSSTAT